MADGWWLWSWYKWFSFLLFFDIRYSVLLHCNRYRYLSIIDWHTDKDTWLREWKNEKKINENRPAPKANTKFNQIISISFSVWRELVNLIAFFIPFFSVYDWNMFWGYANSTTIIIQYVFFLFFVCFFSRYEKV